MTEGNEAKGAGSAEPPPDPVAALEARLGLPLADRSVALAALTHKSYVNEHREETDLTDNERLEFLGDAVVDLAVSHRLMQRFPGAREGELSKMRAAVVDEQGLAQMARALDLGALLRLGRGEELTGGRRKASLLADAMEAVIAAIFVGGGLEPVLSLVDRFLDDAFARASAGTLDRDYKTQLQELAQSRLRATPRYRVVREIGPDHSKTFEVETDLRGEVVGRGAGRSKKDAEQVAARGALDVLGRRFADTGDAPAGEPDAGSADSAAVQPGTDAPAAPEPSRDVAAPGAVAGTASPGVAPAVVNEHDDVREAAQAGKGGARPPRPSPVAATGTRRKPRPRARPTGAKRALKAPAPGSSRRTKKAPPRKAKLAKRAGKGGRAKK